jgi:hypothetical protein
VDVGDGVGVISKVADLVEVAVLLVGDSVGDRVSVIVGVGLCVLVGSGVIVSVGMGVRLLVCVGVGVRVSDGVTLEVSVIVGINVWVGGNGVNDGVNEGKGVAMIGVTGVFVFVGGMVIVGVGVGRVFILTVIIPAQ